MEKMIDDLIEIFNEENEKRRLITPKNMAEKLIVKGYRRQDDLVKEILDEIRQGLDFNKEFHNYNIGTGYAWAMGEVRKCLSNIERKYALGIEIKKFGGK